MIGQVAVIARMTILKYRTNNKYAGHDWWSQQLVLQLLLFLRHGNDEPAVMKLHSMLILTNVIAWLNSLSPGRLLLRLIFIHNITKYPIQSSVFLIRSTVQIDEVLFWVLYEIWETPSKYIRKHHQRSNYYFTIMSDWSINRIIEITFHNNS